MAVSGSGGAESRVSVVVRLWCWVCGSLLTPQRPSLCVDGLPQAAWGAGEGAPGHVGEG